MEGVSHAGDDNFRIKGVIAVYFNDLFDQHQAILGQIIETADEGADERRPGLSDCVALDPDWV